MEKINYYKESLKIIESTSDSNKKRRILIHACCGPCSAWPLKFLLDNDFEVTIFFNNSNIYPSFEYERRLKELQKFIATYSAERNTDIKVIVTPYDNDNYCKDLEPYKDESEGLTRCRLCYKKRMNEAYRYADENGYDFFTTVMTISRQKNSQIINAIGKELESIYKNCRYFYSDFKKNDGINIGREMRNHFNMYQQDYCGCKYTFPKSKIYNNKIDKNKKV